VSVFKQKAKTGGGDFTPVAAGTYPAVLAALLDIGTYRETFQGQKPKDVRKIVLVWELDADGGRYFIGRDYTLSLADKAHLRALVEKWRGKSLGDEEEFDLEKLVGRPCLLSVSHKEAKSGNTYARVDGAAALMKGMTAIKPTHAPFAWSVEGGDSFPDHDWVPYLRGEPLAEVIKGCHERTGRRPDDDQNREEDAQAVGAKEIPF
jgi:hypothetical protein